MSKILDRRAKVALIVSQATAIVVDLRLYAATRGRRFTLRQLQRSGITQLRPGVVGTLALNCAQMIQHHGVLEARQCRSAGVGQSERVFGAVEAAESEVDPAQ